MSYLLDTCVLSQLRKNIPENVKKWFENKEQDQFYISVVTIAELWDGIERLPNSKKKKELESWFLGEVQSRFKGRVLPIDEDIAIKWGTLNSTNLKNGKILGTQDLYMAATAVMNNLALVTLNEKDFETIQIVIINPWNM